MIPKILKKTKRENKRETEIKKIVSMKIDSDPGIVKKIIEDL